MGIFREFWGATKWSVTSKILMRDGDFFFFKKTKTLFDCGWGRGA
jgi:hypothetical protein